jgi:bifunctional non-homologous end joining protein LigD
MGKKHRGGKIFLDFFRNARMATAVGPWSTRARDGGTIAMPLAWTQLRSALQPAVFNLGVVDAIHRAKDPWKDLPGSASSLEDARAKLARI